MIAGMLFARPLLVLFGASEDALVYAYPYMIIYLIGTVPSMIATGMNPFINAQGYATTGMLSVAIGAVANLILDPLFIFVLGFGIKGAAIATVLSQFLSAAYVLLFLEKRAEMKARLLKKNRAEKLQRKCKKHCQSWYCRFHYAADKQPGNHLLQQCSGSHRRGWLHIGYDDCIQCTSDGRDSDLCHERRYFPDSQL